MSVLKPYRPPRLGLLLIILCFALLMLLCWYGYEKQIQQLDQQLRQRQQQVEMMP